MPQQISLLLKQGPAFLLDTPEDASEHLEQQKPLLQQDSSCTLKTNPIYNGDEGDKGDKHSEDLQVTTVSEILEEHSSQPTYTPPNELWSSLSQWIPHSALYQPSLHHQAFLESSGIQDHTYPLKKDLERVRQRPQVQNQYARQSQQTKPYRPKNVVHEKQVTLKKGTGPLFI
jgi:hypothetical protein